VLYDPGWLSLLDARERLRARGAARAEVETAICLATRDLKFKIHVTIERAIYAPTGATLSPTYIRALEFKEGIKLRLRVPFDLKPEDIDWDNSRPTRAWPYGPWQHALLAHIARIEVWRADFERAFPMLRGANAAEQARGANERLPDLKEAREDDSSPGAADLGENTQPAEDSGRTYLSNETLEPEKPANALKATKVEPDGEQALEGDPNADILEAKEGKLVKAVALELRRHFPESRPRAMKRKDLVQYVYKESGGKISMFSLATLDRATLLAWPEAGRPPG
jgi:hypothetical protein